MERFNKTPGAVSKSSFNTPTGRQSTPRFRGSSKKTRLPFKSPMRRDVTPTSKQEDVTSLQSECARLTSKEADLDRQIQELRDGGLDESELSAHITKLHEYNEIKDIAQMLIGRIAEQRGTTTRELYPHFGLDFED